MDDSGNSPQSRNHRMKNTSTTRDQKISKAAKTPIAVKAGDTIRVECTFDPTLRQKIMQLKSLAPRYVTWGEGSSDEMCLGVIAGAKP